MSMACAIRPPSSRRRVPRPSRVKVENVMRQASIKSALLLATALALAAPSQAAAPGYDVFEKSIADLQSDLASGRVTSHQLVEAYLARIAAYDQAGPKLNAIVTLNPKAIEEADALDKERAGKKIR